MVTFPDLPGCMSDGETIEEVIQNGIEAVECWIKTAEKVGDPVPEPGDPIGRLVLRLPKSLHTRLIARAKQENVSMNTLAVALLTDGLASQEHKQQ